MRRTLDISIDVDFKDLVKKIRRVRSMTQEQLARELNVTFGTVNGWENGKHRPIPSLGRRLFEMAEAAGVSLRSSGARAERPSGERSRRRRT